MTQEQVSQIVININDMLDKARSNIQGIDEICDEQYLQGRSKYPITAIVYSAFNVEEQNIPGFTIQKVEYGGRKRMFLPELYNDGMLIEVFGDSAKPLTINEVKTKLRLLGDRLHLLIFSVDKEEYVLSKLQLWSLDGFNENGNVRVTNKENLYEIK